MGLIGWILGAAVTSAASARAEVGPMEAPPSAAAIESGRQLLTRYHCGSCHAIPGVSAARGTLAVSLAGMGRRSYIAGRIPNDSANLARWIVRPASLVADTRMPDMGVSPADARDMAAYLGHLR